MDENLTKEEKEKIELFNSEIAKEKPLLKKAGISIENRKWSIFHKICTGILILTIIVFSTFFLIFLSQGKFQSIISTNLTNNINLPEQQTNVLAPITSSTANNYTINIVNFIDGNRCNCT